MSSRLDLCFNRLLSLVLLVLSLMLLLLSVVFRYVFDGCVSAALPGASIAESSVSIA